MSKFQDTKRLFLAVFETIGTTQTNNSFSYKFSSGKKFRLIDARLFHLVCVTVFLGVSPAWSDEWEDEFKPNLALCIRNETPRTQAITACTWLLKPGFSFGEDRGTIYYLRGIRYLQRNEFTKATRDFQFALRFRPDWNEADAKLKRARQSAKPAPKENGKGEWKQIKNQSNCLVWNPAPGPNEKVSWTGPCVNGTAEGEGEMAWTSLKDGQWTKGSRYVGMMKAGRQHGRGKSIYSNGDTREANFLNGDINGDVIYLWTNGDSYLGEWKGSEPHGYGVHISASSRRRYEGEWVNGNFYGHGRMFWKDGDTYEGAWVDDKLEGRGKFIEKGDSTFIGHYRNNKRNGYGVSLKLDGSTYKGAWKDNKRHGRGIRMDGKTKTHVGTFYKGYLHGEGEQNYGKGGSEKGVFEWGKLHGRGVRVEPDGERNEGQFVNGEFQMGWGFFAGKFGEKRSGLRYESDRYVLSAFEDIKANFQGPKSRVLIFSKEMPVTKSKKQKMIFEHAYDLPKGKFDMLHAKYFEGFEFKGVPSVIRGEKLALVFGQFMPNNSKWYYYARLSGNHENPNWCSPRAALYSTGIKMDTDLSRIDRDGDASVDIDLTFTPDCIPAADVSIDMKCSTLVVDDKKFRKKRSYTLTKGSRRKTANMSIDIEVWATTGTVKAKTRCNFDNRPGSGFSKNDSIYSESKY